MYTRLHTAGNQVIFYADVPLHQQFLHCRTLFRYRYVLLKEGLHDEQYVDSKYEWREISIKGMIKAIIITIM